MPNRVLSFVHATVRALLPADWRGRAGQRFRRMMNSISEFAESNGVRPADLAEEAVDLGRRKLHGSANRDLAAAVKDFAEAEQKRIQNELQRRSLESQVEREEAETRLAKLKVLDAEVELLNKLTEAGVVLHFDERGNLTVLPAVVGCDLGKLAKRLPSSVTNELPVREDLA